MMEKLQRRVEKIKITLRKAKDKLKTQSQKIKAFVISAAVTGSVVLANAVPAYAVGEVSSGKVTSGIDSFRTILQGFGEPICIIVMVIAGIALMGGQQGRQWAKPTMLFAAIGYAIVKFAPDIVKLLTSSFA